MSNTSDGTYTPTITTPEITPVCKYRLPCGYCEILKVMCTTITFTPFTPIPEWKEITFDTSMTGAGNGESDI